MHVVFSMFLKFLTDEFNALIMDIEIIVIVSNDISYLSPLNIHINAHFNILTFYSHINTFILALMAIIAAGRVKSMKSTSRLK